MQAIFEVNLKDTNLYQVMKILQHLFNNLPPLAAYDITCTSRFIFIHSQFNHFQPES